MYAAVPRITAAIQFRSNGRAGRGGGGGGGAGSCTDVVNAVTVPASSISTSGSSSPTTSAIVVGGAGIVAGGGGGAVNVGATRGAVAIISARTSAADLPMSPSVTFVGARAKAAADTSPPLEILTSGPCITIALVFSAAGEGLRRRVKISSSMLIAAASSSVGMLSVSISNCTCVAPFGVDVAHKIKDTDTYVNSIPNWKPLQEM